MDVRSFQLVSTVCVGQRHISNIPAPEPPDRSNEEKGSLMGRMKESKMKLPSHFSANSFRRDGNQFTTA